MYNLLEHRVNPYKIIRNYLKTIHSETLLQTKNPIVDTIEIHIALTPLNTIT